MIESISKPRLPTGLSYVLKTSQLAQALADIDIHVDLDYWSPQTLGSILEGHYWPPNANFAYPRLYVRAGVVSRSLRPLACEALTEKALPAFVQWLRAIVDSPDGVLAPHKPVYFNAKYTTQGLVITNKPVYKKPRSDR